MPADFLFITARVLIVCSVFAYFAFMALRCRYRYSVRITICLFGSVILATAAIIIVFLTPHTLLSSYNLYGIILWLVMAMVVVGVGLKISVLELLFLVLVVLNLYVNIVAIAKITAYQLNLNVSMDIVCAVIAVSVTILYIPLLKFLFIKLYSQVLELNISSFFWKFIWMIPALTYMIFYVKIIEDYWKNLIHVTSHDVLFSILWSLTTYVFFCVALQMLIQAYKGISVREEMKLMKAQLRMQEGQYKNLLESNEKTARIQHDMRHHLLSINGFIESGDMEKLLDYLNPLITQYGTQREVSVCQNHVVDVILQHYAAKARKYGASIQIKADIPEDIDISDTDLCIVFGNLMENAVDACLLQNVQKASINVRAGMENDKLVALVSNTYQNKILVEQDCFFSTKHDGVGLGLSSVKKVAENYGGQMKVEYEGTYFEVFVLLNQKNQNSQSNPAVRGLKTKKA